MSRPQKYGERVELSIRINPELKDRLQRVADERVVSMSLVVNRAIEDLLDQLDPVEAWRYK